MLADLFALATASAFVGAAFYFNIAQQRSCSTTSLSWGSGSQATRAATPCRPALRLCPGLLDGCACLGGLKGPG